MRNSQLKISTLVGTALLFISLAGCRAGGWFPAAGTMNEQQANAIVHDPFPQNDIAPYEAASRPPSYQQPLPEPVRNRLIPDAMPWLGR
ncbi:membrane or secreted protein [Novipirellula sp. SH528]|uniref:membrane or secreted protein n=1 Tax=Novipirellula sp. SH528 TaxID=3454466 RepID=UPI003F9F8051